MIKTNQVSFVLFISGVAALGGFLFGFDSAVINGTVRALSGAFGTGSLGSGFSVASVLQGCAAGALVAGSLAKRFSGVTNRQVTRLWSLRAVKFLLAHRWKI